MIFMTTAYNYDDGACIYTEKGLLCNANPVLFSKVNLFLSDKFIENAYRMLQLARDQEDGHE